MKAMRKDRNRRYRSASELSDDIQNYLTGMPLIAGPESNVYRARKFVHKHAGFVASAALVAVVIVIGLITSTAFSFSAEKARGKEASARTQAEQAYAQAEQARGKEVAARTEAEKAEKVAQEQRKLAEDNAEDYRRSLYVNSIQLADAKYREGNITNARTLLESCPEDLRGWEWDRVNHVLDHSVLSFAAHKGSVALSPDGKRLVTGSRDTALTVWDITTGNELATRSGAHNGRIVKVDFSPDGKRIASCDASGEVKVWDTADVNKPITSIKHGTGWISGVSFSPDGNQIVSAMTTDGTIKVWDAATGAERLVLSGYKGGEQGGVALAAFSPNGKDIVAAGRDGIIKIWDSVSGDEVMSFEGHDNVINTVSFNSDGTLFASGSDDKTIKIWNATTGSIVETLYGHDGPINAVAFSPDDKYIIWGSWVSTVRIWDIATGMELRNLRGHEGWVNSVVFTPDGKQAVSAGGGIIKVWDVNVDREINRFLGQGSIVSSVAFSPNGKRLISRSFDRNVKLWDLISCDEIMTFSGGGENWDRNTTSFSPDGKKIASLNKIEAIVIRDAETGHEITTLGNQEDNVSCLAYSPDGKHIVSGSSHGKLKLWDVKKGEEIITLSEGKSGINSLAFSPDGKHIVSGHGDGKVKVWDVASGTELMSLIGDRTSISKVVFSPDGKRIASSRQGGSTAKIWDAVTGKELKTLQGHGDLVMAVAFSPDGRRLVTGSRDGTAKVWDSSTGDEILTLHADSAVSDVAFSPDGKTIAGCTFGKTIVLWDSASPEGGYEPRKIGMAARSMVDELHETHGLYHNVIEKLEADTMLDEPVRKVALQIANSRKGEDAEIVAEEGWEIVSSADKDIDVYKSIVDQAQKVARSEPENTSVLRTLGVGQYRVGDYADSLATLKNAEKMRADERLESDPNSVAFIAMTHFQLGQVDEARSVIKPFRDSLGEMRFVDITSDKLSCWIDAEAVFCGTHEQLVAIWKLISTNELDRAVAMFLEIEPSSEELDSDFAFSLKGLSKYLSRVCCTRGKSRLLSKDLGYIDTASDYENAIRIDPNYISALKDLTWLQITCPDDKVRNPAEAADRAKLACEITMWKNHTCLSVLAAAYSENGRFTDAIKWQQQAIDLLTGDDRWKWEGNYRERLHLYQSSMPYSAGELWSFTEGKLVSFWDFNDVEDSVVNNQVVDAASGRLLIGTKIVADGARGSVLDVRDEGKVECTEESDLDITGAISVGAWVKLRPSKGWNAIVSKGKGCWNLWTDRKGHICFSIYVPNYEDEDPEWIPVDANANLKDGQWHHVVGTYNGERLCVYVDGKLGASKFVRGKMATNDSPVVIGDGFEYKPYNWSWSGLIDDVCIYSYALTADEVKDLCEGREPPREKKKARHN